MMQVEFVGSKFRSEIKTTMTDSIALTELNQCAAFAQLSSAECKILAPFLIRDSVSAGETILTIGHTTQALWVIREGQCEVIRPTTNGSSTVLATLEQCSVFGEMSFFDGAPHSASVKAKTDASFYWLPREAFDALEIENPQLTHRITLYVVRIIADRLRKMDAWVSSTVENPDAVYKKEWHEFRAKLFS